MSKKKKGNGPGRLSDLNDWIKRPFVDKMLDDGESPNKVAQWCNENGFEISVPTMYTYAKKRKEAIIKGEGVKRVLGKEPEPPQPPKPRGGTKEGRAKREANEKVVRKEQGMSSGNKVLSDLQLLDAVIQKGMDTLNAMDYIKPDTAIKAIELKNKLTGGAHNGITTYGLEELRLREAARENAITVILLRFIPEDQHEAVLEEMEKATKEYYESIGLGDAYEQLDYEENIADAGV